MLQLLCGSTSYKTLLHGHGGVLGKLWILSIHVHCEILRLVHPRLSL